MKQINFFKLALALALFSSTFFSASAKDVYLSEGGNDGNDGSSGFPVLTLRKAFDLSSQQGTIYVSGTVDGYTGQNGIYGTCFFSDNTAQLTIQGVDNTAKIVTNGTGRMFYLRSDAELTLRDITLSGTPNDTLDAPGGCIRMGGGSLIAENAIFENFSVSKSITAQNVGGGVLQVEGVSPVKPLIAFKNCIFRNNVGGDVGGCFYIYQFGTNAVANPLFYVENCSFIQNRCWYTYGNGGAVIGIRVGAATGATVTFVNSTIAKNGDGARNSGTINMIGGTLTLNMINCTVKENDAQGLIISAMASSTLNILNCIMEGNSVVSASKFDVNYISPPNPETNTINVQNSFLNLVRNLPAYTKPAGYTNVNQLLYDFDATTNSFTPKRGSMAIGYGDKQYLEGLGTDGTTTIGYDQSGNIRLFADNKCDAGAIEMGNETAVWASASGSDANAGTQSAPVASLQKAFSLCGGSQTDTIYVSGNIDGYTGITGNGLGFAANAKLTIQGLEGTGAGITGDEIRMFYLNNNAVLTLKDLHLSGNPEKSLIGQGGFVFINGGGALYAENTTFENFSTAFNPANEATPGNDTGGAGVVFLGSFNTGSANPILSFKNCQFKNNSSTGNWGGGVMRVQDFGAVTNPTIYFENCGFYGNTSSRLGGSVIFVRAGNGVTPHITFINSTITACGAGGNGVIYPYGGDDLTLNIINSTIKDNPVNGIYSWSLTRPKINIYNSVIEGNTGANVYDVAYYEKTDYEGTLHVSNSLIGNALWGNVAAEAIPYVKPAEYTVGTLFEELDATTIGFTPKQGSLAINYGDKQYLADLAIDYDQLNNERWFKNDLCDAGAVETIKIPIFRGAGAWSETGKWNTQALPAATDEVIIDGDVNVAADVEIAGVTVNAEKSLSLSAGKQLAVTGTLVNDGTVSFLSDDAGTGQLILSSATGNGVVKLTKTFTPLKWYPIGFPFAIDTDNIYCNTCEDENDPPYLLAPSTDEASGDGDFWLKAYNGETNLFEYTQTIAANTGYIIEFPEYYDSDPITVTFTATGAPALANAAEADLSPANGYNMIVNPSVGSLNLSAANQYYLYDGANFPLKTETGASVVKPFEAFVTIGSDITASGETLRSSVGTGIEIDPPITGLTLTKDVVIATEYYNLQGIKIQQPASNGIYMVKKKYASQKTEVTKIIINDTQR